MTRFAETDIICFHNVMENLPFQNYDFAFANGICAVVGIVRPQTTPTRLLSGTFRLLDMTATISFTVTN